MRLGRSFFRRVEVDAILAAFKAWAVFIPSGWQSHEGTTMKTSFEKCYPFKIKKARLKGL